MKDALGRDLVVGQTYGYSRSDNGITTVKIGKLVKINEKMVSLEVQESKRAVYTNDLEKRRYTNKIISVKANGLFPVYPDVPVIESWNDLQVLYSAEWDDVIRRNYLMANYSNGVIVMKGGSPVKPISLGDRVTTEHYDHGEVFEVVGIRKDELELRGDWSGGTHNVDQTGWYPKDKCKKVQL
jgi:hypothetical protein